MSPHAKTSHVSITPGWVLQLEPDVVVLDANCVGAFFFFFQAEDGIRDLTVTGVQTCALPISAGQGGARVRSPNQGSADQTGGRRRGPSSGLGSRGSWSRRRIDGPSRVGREPVLGNSRWVPQPTRGPPTPVRRERRPFLESVAASSDT